MQFIINQIMVKSKILYDNVIMTAKEWENSVDKLSKDYPSLGFPDLMDLTSLEAVQSHYFAICSNNPQEIISGIRNQLKSKLGDYSPIVFDAVLESLQHSRFYRIDCPKEVVIYIKDILDKPAAWIKDKTLHSKGTVAIKNLLKRLESDKL